MFFKNLLFRYPSTLIYICLYFFFFGSIFQVWAGWIYREGNGTDDRTDKISNSDRQCQPGNSLHFYSLLVNELFEIITDDFPIWFVQGGELDAIDGMTPLDMVVRILNNQLSSLMWIDEKVNIFYPDPFYLKNNVMFINLSFTIKCVQDFHTN